MDPFTAAMLALEALFRYMTEVEKNLTPERREKLWAVADKICDALDKLKPKGT
jgi:hypothetical protein